MIDALTPHCLARHGPGSILLPALWALLDWLAALQLAKLASLFAWVAARCD
jgi:hypothetical protein